MKKLPAITAIALALFLFSACKKNDPVQKDDSKVQIAVKMQLKIAGPKGKIIGKPTNAIVIGQKDKLKKRLMQNNGFRLERTSKTYPTYILTAGMTIHGTGVWKSWEKIDCPDCPVQPPEPPCSQDIYDEWIQDNYAQWKEEANSTCETTVYSLYQTDLCTYGGGDLPPAYICKVGPDFFDSDCFTLPDGPNRYDEIFDIIYNPVPVPSAPFDTATLIEKVYR